MPITYSIYTATGGQTSFAVPFPFIDSAHIKVDINGTNTAAFTYNSGTTSVVLTSGATGGDKVKVWRETPGRTDSAKILLVDFQDGSVLSESDLDKVTQQLLYLAQEAEETGASSLPVDWDGHYDAQEKRIKRIQASPVDGQDVASKSYVDGLTLHGDGYSPQAIPQAWAKVGSDFTGTTGDCTLVLASPTPASETEELFVVSLNGLTQRPTTDFTITEAGGTYTLTLKMGSATLASADIINIMNFGVARSLITQPIVPDTTSSVGLTIKGNSGQSEDLIQCVNSSDSELFSVNADGMVQVGGDTAATNTEITASRFEIKDHNNADETKSGFIATVVNDSGGVPQAKVGIQGKEGGLHTTPAFFVHDGDDYVTRIDYGGDHRIYDPGFLTVGYGSVSAPAGTSLGAGDILANDGLFTGNINLEGFLQTGGASLPKILSIQEFTNTGTDGDGYHKSDDTTGNDWVVSGKRLTITPKSTSSKLLILGRLRCLYKPTGADILAGGYVYIHRGNTASPGAVQNGSTTGISSIFERQYTHSNSSATMFNLGICEIIEPGTTSERVYDLTHKKYYFSDGTSGTDYFAPYFDGKSSLVAIEYIQP